jgi:membrane protein
MITVRAMLSDVSGFLLFVFRRWREDRCPQIAGSLTYTSLLALVPMFAIAIAVLSSAPFFESVITQFKGFLVQNLVPEIANRIITVYMAKFSDNAERLTWAGTGTVLVIAVAQMLIIDRSLNAIWRVRRARPLWRSVVGYAVLLVASPVLLGIGLSITTYLMSLSFTAGGVPREIHSIGLRLIPFTLTAAAFLLMYMVIPNRRVPWRHAAIGAAVAAVLFEAAKELFAYYVRYAPTYNLVYGTFAAFPLFLIWIYLSWLVVLLGAELTASLGYWPGRLWKRERTAGIRFRAAVDVARVLMQAHPGGISVERIRADTGLPLQEADEALMALVDADLARRAGRAGYALAKPAEAITFRDLYRAAVGPVGGMSPQEWEEVSPAFSRAAAAMEASLGQPFTLAEAGGPGQARTLRKARRGRARSGRSSR